MVKFLPSLKTQTTSNTLDHSSFPVATHLPFKFPHVTNNAKSMTQRMYP